MAKGLKIAFISGPANAREIYREWSRRDQQSYFGTDYMKQFMQLASDAGAKSYVITWYGDRREAFELDHMTIDNRPATRSRGVAYYFNQIAWHLSVLLKLISFRPNVLLLTGNQNFWWMLSPLRLWNCAIIVSYHAVLWPKFGRVPFAWRASLQLNRFLILRHAKAIVVTSNDIQRQVRALLANAAAKVPIVHHLPTYSRQQFADVRPPVWNRRKPFRVNFTGRIVRNKGVYDVIEMARQLNERHPGEYHFDICGDGEELASIKKLTSDLGLDETVTCHGFCGTERLQALLGASDVSIVPTRTDCEAGFEMTCAEAILAGRPLITSAVCPALEYVQAGALEVLPEDIGGYRDAIASLHEDGELYDRKRRACAGLQEQFYDPANSWYKAMRTALDMACRDQPKH